MISLWMLYAIALAAAIGLAGLAVERVLHLVGYPGRWVWAACLAASIALPVALPVVERLTGGSEGASVAVGEAVAVTDLRGALDAPARGGGRWIARLEAGLAWGWALASLVGTVGLIGSALSLRRLRRRWRSARVAGAEVLLSRDTGPAVVGCLRAAVVLPEWVLDCPESQQALIVAHEREHVSARDPLLMVSGWIALVLMPWSLPLWWQVRRLRLAVEVDCDRRVLRRIPDVQGYGTLLVEVGRRASGRWLPATGFSEPASFLERRIRSMTSRKPRNRVVQAVIMGAAALAVPVLLYATPVVHHPAIDRVGAWLAADAAPSVQRAAPPVGAVRPTDVLPARAPADPARPTRPGPADTVPDGIGGFAHEVAALDRKPSLADVSAVVRAMEEVYPRSLRDAGVRGTASMQFVIEPDGSVNRRSIRVVESSREEFGAASAKALESFRFQPGEIQGRKVRVLIQMPITWTPPKENRTGAAEPPRLRSGQGARDTEGIMVVDRNGASVDVEMPHSSARKHAPSHEEVVRVVTARHPNLGTEIRGRKSTLLVIADSLGRVDRSEVVSGGLPETVKRQKELGYGPDRMYIVMFVEGSKVPNAPGLEQVVWFAHR